MMNARTRAGSAIAGLAPLACLCLLASLPAVALAQPAAVVDPLEVDFGQMDQFEARSSSFTIRNTGDAPLHITGIEATCGCTATKPSVDILAPGRSTEVPFTFNSEKFRGPQLKLVKVHTDDPSHGTIDFKIRADVHAAILVSPVSEILKLRKFLPGEAPFDTIGFAAADGAPLRLEAVDYDQDLFELKILDDPSGEASQKVAVIGVRPPQPIGYIREIVSFETNVEKRPNVNIEVRGMVVAPVSIEPEQVNLRYLKRKEVVTQAFKVNIRRGTDLSVTGAEIDLPGFEVTAVKPRPEFNTVTVIIEGTPVATSDERAVASRGRMKGTLRIFTDHPEFRELNASVTYLLKL